MYEVNETSLEFMPLLKQQLTLFVGLNYEEAADYSNYSLVQEYLRLERHDLLAYLSDAEYLTSEVRLRMEYGC